MVRFLPVPPTVCYLKGMRNLVLVTPKHHHCEKLVFQLEQIFEIILGNITNRGDLQKFSRW